MSRVTLHIDRLVLPAMPPGDRKALVAGLQAELTRALADPAARAAWARSHRTPVLRLGRLPLPTDPSGSKTFGATLGRSVGKGLQP